LQMGFNSGFKGLIVCIYVFGGACCQFYKIYLYNTAQYEQH